MGAMASHITSLTIVYAIVYSGADQSFKKTSKLRASAFVRVIQNSPHKWPETRKMFPFDDVIMELYYEGCNVLNCIYTFRTLHSFA